MDRIMKDEWICRMIKLSAPKIRNLYICETEIVYIKPGVCIFGRREFVSPKKIVHDRYLRTIRNNN